jgi:hypothetical protein
LGGKYEFNFKSGNEFCKYECNVDLLAPKTVCFDKGIKECGSCSYKYEHNNEKGRDSQQLCQKVCKSIDDEKCDFFAYLNGEKKIINKKLLNRFGKIFVKKYIRNNARK